jgi:hypothetical protein
MSKEIFQGVSLATHIDNRLGLHVQLSCNDCGVCGNSEKELGMGEALNNCEIAKQFHENKEELESKYNASLYINTNDKCGTRRQAYPSVSINFSIPFIGTNRINEIHFGIGKEWATIIHKAGRNKSL